MTKSIFCKKFINQAQPVRVKVIKAPFVDSGTLREILFQRQRALVL